MIAIKEMAFHLDCKVRSQVDVYIATRFFVNSGVLNMKQTVIYLALFITFMVVICDQQLQVAAHLDDGFAESLAIVKRNLAVSSNKKAFLKYMAKQIKAAQAQKDDS